MTFDKRGIYFPLFFACHVEYAQLCIIFACIINLIPMSGDKFKIKLGDQAIGIAEDMPVENIEKTTENFDNALNEYIANSTVVLYRRVKNKYYFRNKKLKLIVEFHTPVNIMHNKPILISSLL